MWPFRSKPKVEIPDPKDGTSEKWCLCGGEHNKQYRRGDTTQGQWQCSKCGFAYGPTGIYDFGMLTQGKPPDASRGGNENNRA